jgi:hypothetical protein
MEQIKIKEELSLLADGRDHTSRAATSRNSSGPGGLSGLRTTAVENFQKLSSPNFAADDVDELLASFCSYFKEAVSVKQQDSKGTEQSAYSPQSKLRNRGYRQQTPGSAKHLTRWSVPSFSCSVADANCGNTTTEINRESDVHQCGKLDISPNPEIMRRRKSSPRRSLSMKRKGFLEDKSGMQLCLDGLNSATADHLGPPDSVHIQEKTHLTEKSSHFAPNSLVKSQSPRPSEPPDSASAYLAVQEDQILKVSKSPVLTEKTEQGFGIASTVPHDTAALADISFTENRALNKQSKSAVEGEQLSRPLQARRFKSQSMSTVLVQLAYDEGVQVPRTTASFAARITSLKNTGGTERKGPKLRKPLSVDCSGKEEISEEVGGEITKEDK